MGYTPSDSNLALALALQGVPTSDGDLRRMVGVARILEAVPAPEIDPGFAARLEARLMTEDLGLVHAVRPTPRPDEASELPEAEHRAAIIRLPRRRFVIRKALAFTIAAAMALALPVVASMGALPGSPGYGLKLKMEQLRLAAATNPIDKGFVWLGIAGIRLEEVRQLAALDRPALIPETLTLLEIAQRNGTRLILDASRNKDVLARAAGLLQSHGVALQELLPTVPLAERDDVLDAIRTGQTLSLRVAAALGLPMIRPPATVEPGASAPEEIVPSGSADADLDDVESASDKQQPSDGSETPEGPDACNPRAPKLTCGDIHTDSTFAIPVGNRGPKHIFERDTGPVAGCPDATTCALYRLNGYRWPANAQGLTSIDFWVNPAQAWMSETDAKNAAVAATRSWSQANPNIRFSFKGTTTRHPLNGARAKNGYNDIYWSPLDPGIVAIASVRSSAGRILEADITLNSLLRWGWTPCAGLGRSCTATNLGAYDVQAIATHEVGHLLGLGHFDRGLGQRIDPTSDLSMNAHPNAGERKQATLGLGDVLGIRAAYPYRGPMPPVYAP